MYIATHCFALIYVKMYLTVLFQGGCWNGQLKSGSRNVLSNRQGQPQDLRRCVKSCLFIRLRTILHNNRLPGWLHEVEVNGQALPIHPFFVRKNINPFRGNTIYKSNVVMQIKPNFVSNFNSLSYCTSLSV